MFFCPMITASFVRGGRIISSFLTVLFPLGAIGAYAAYLDQNFSYGERVDCLICGAKPNFHRDIQSIAVNDQGFAAFSGDGLHVHPLLHSRCLNISLPLDGFYAIPSGFSSVVSLSRLPSDNEKGQKERSRSYPIWPCESIDPAWRILELICFLCALGCLVWCDHNPINMACIFPMVILAGFCIAGHPKNCHDQDEKQEHRPIFNGQYFPHNPAIVPPAILTTGSGCIRMDQEHTEKEAPK
jgi:hypothetical protein